MITILKKIIEYIVLVITVFLIVKYVFSLFVINNELLMITKINNIKVGDEVIVVTDKVKKETIIKKTNDIYLIDNNILINDENIYGKIIFKIWPIF